MKSIFAYCALTVVFLFGGTVARAQDPLKVAPQAFKERLNNSEVRVLEYSSKPGEKEALHSHPAVLLVILHGGKIKSTTPDGKSTETEYKDGDVIWRDAITHTGENTGTTEVKTLLIEVKHGKKK